MISDPAALPAQQLLGRALLPLRAFLGFTFCFAGLQKLANPRFFDAADPASIQSQLAGAARLSPIHALIAPLVHLAVPLGILIACGELAIGTCTLLGLWSRLAAAGGLALSVMLFLTVSFHATPYYTGSDIVFVFAWTPLLLAGPGSVLSLDAAIPAWVARRARDEETGPRSWPAAEEASRREVTLKAVATIGAAAAAMIAAGVAAGWGRLAGATAGTTAGAHTRDAPGTPQATATPGKVRHGTHPARRSARRVACLSGRRRLSRIRPLENHRSSSSRGPGSSLPSTRCARTRGARLPMTRLRSSLPARAMAQSSAPARARSSGARLRPD